MRRLLCLFLSLMLLPLAALCEEASPVPDTAELDEAFGAIFRRYKTTGGVIVIARGEEILYQRNYGYAYRTDKELVTDDTYFRIASVSKLVSAIHVMQMVEQGKLSLDEDISTYFGYTIRNPEYPGVPITLRQLMSHTSSISPTGGYANSSTATVRQMLALENRRMANYYDFEPGSDYTYSNLGAGLMGSMVESVTGMNLNDSINIWLFAPLGIDAAYTPKLLCRPEKIVYCYDDTGKLMVGRRGALEQPWDEGVDPERHFRLVPGAVWIKGRDLCRLGMLLCNGGTLDGVTILQPDTVSAMLESQQGKPGITMDSPYGLCVYRRSMLLDDRIVYGHQGMSNGMSSVLLFEPESKLVVAILTNGCDSRQDHRMCIIHRKLFAKAWEVFGEEGVN